MTRSTGFRSAVIALSTATLWFGCNAIVGNDNAIYAPPDATSEPGTDGGTDAATDGAGPTDGAGADAYTDGADANCAGDLSCDPHNCGAPLHDCLGGACMSGLCPSILLASGQPSTDGLAVDAEYVYWANAGTSQLGFTDGSVHRANKSDGSQALAIAVGQGGAGGIQLDATNLYWTDYQTGSVLVAAKDGTGLRTLVTGIMNPGGIALDPPRIYMTVPTGGGLDGSVGYIPLDGGAYTPLAFGLYNPQAVLLDTSLTHLFWVNYGSYADGGGGSVQSLALGGGGAAVLGPAGGASALVYDGSRLYWNNSTPIDGGSIGAVAVDGGALTSLASGLGGPTGVAVDAAHVYYADSGGIWRVKKDGTERLLLAQNQNHPGVIVLDNQYAYWGNIGSVHNQDGQVLKVAK